MVVTQTVRSQPEFAFEAVYFTGMAKLVLRAKTNVLIDFAFFT